MPPYAAYPKPLPVTIITVRPDQANDCTIIQDMICTDHLHSLGIDLAEAKRLGAQINSLLSNANPEVIWQQVSQSVLRPNLPFQVHQYVCDAIFENWDDATSPRPMWSPTSEEINRSNIDSLRAQLSISDYNALHQWSVGNQEVFTKLTIERLGIQFHRYPSQMLNLSNGVESACWLDGAQLNIVKSCFQADADKPAIVFNKSSDQIGWQTYGELRTLANRVSNGLVEAGFGPSDAIAIDMPMTPESVAIYLGIIQCGATVVSIADSFAPPEIATRLKIANAKAIFTMDHIIRTGKRLPLYKKLIAANAPKTVVVLVDDSELAYLRDGDQHWSQFLSDNPNFKPHIAPPDHAINILFSSGTTGVPKAIPWTQITAIKSATDGYYHHDIHPGDVLAWPTNLGWMMGPWLIFAAMINRGTIALFNDVPSDRGFGKFIEKAHVNMLGVVPSLVRRWRETECMKGLDWSSIRTFSSTGECSNPSDMFYLMHLAGYRPIIEYCGGTEIGGGYITSTIVQPNAPSTFTTPTLGSDFIILDERGVPGDFGEVFLIPPAMGLSSRLLNRDHHEVYYGGTPSGPEGQLLRRHGDQIKRLTGGYYRALGRVDDTMNLGGVKVGSVEIERVLNRLDGVAETAAIAISPPDGGPSQLVIFTVLESTANTGSNELLLRMQTTIKREINPLFKLNNLRIVEVLPRTASNKIMRRTLRTLYQKSEPHYSIKRNLDQESNT